MYIYERLPRITLGTFSDDRYTKPECYSIQKANDLTNYDNENSPSNTQPSQFKKLRPPSPTKKHSSKFLGKADTSLPPTVSLALTRPQSSLAPSASHGPTAKTEEYLLVSRDDLALPSPPLWQQPGTGIITRDYFLLCATG
jgi:hypothetical protein